MVVIGSDSNMAIKEDGVWFSACLQLLFHLIKHLGKNLGNSALPNSIWFLGPRFQISKNLLSYLFIIKILNPQDSCKIKMKYYSTKIKQPLRSISLLMESMILILFLIWQMINKNIIIKAGLWTRALLKYMFHGINQCLILWIILILNKINQDKVIWLAIKPT